MHSVEVIVRFLCGEQFEHSIIIIMSYVTAMH